MLPKHVRAHYWDIITKSIPQAVVYIGIAAILLDDAVHTTFDVPSFIVTDLRISIIGAVLASLVWSIAKQTQEVDSALHALRDWKYGSATVLTSWADIDLFNRYRVAKTIKILNLAGTQFAKLGAQETLNSLFDIAKRKEVYILIGDPYGRGIILRYDSGQGEPPTFETGLSGIERRLRDLHERWCELPAKYRRRMQIRVFSQYPTISMVQLDDDYYAATYGFNMRGGDSPKVHVVRGSIYADFLDKHFQNIFNTATPLERWINSHPLGGSWNT